VQALPSGKGWRYVASLLLIEMDDAASTPGGGSRPAVTTRSAAFFDRSRNNSRVWHDVAVCGNLAHLHAHRARKRAQANPGD